MIRFTIIGLFFWGWASVAQAEVKAKAPFVTLGKSGQAIAAAHAPEIVKKAVLAGNKIVGKPYKYGGGHAVFEDAGYDCSGATSFMLREIGAMKGVRSSGGFFNFGERGKGRHVTVWVRKGHVFVTIAGMRFDTQGQTASDGPRWTSKVRDKEKFQPRRLKSWK